MKGKSIENGWKMFHSQWDEAVLLAESGEDAAAMDIFGKAMLTLTESCETDRVIKSGEWMQALGHGLLNYIQLGGVELLFQYSKIIIARLAQYRSGELHELDLDLCEVMRLIGAATIRLSEIGKLSQAVVLARGVNYLAELRRESTDIEVSRLCVSSSILAGRLLLCAGQINEAKSSFESALGYCVKIENSGQDDDPNYHFQCYALGAEVYLANDSYENVALILEVTRKLELKLARSGIMVENPQARCFICTEIAIDRRNQRFHDRLRKAVRLCREIRSDDKSEASVAPIQIALGQSEVALALYDLGRFRAAMIWVDSTVKILKTAGRGGLEIQGNDHLVVAHQILEVVSGLIHHNYDGSLETMHSVSWDLIQLLENLEEDRGSGRDLQMWSDKVLLIRNANILSGFDLIASDWNKSDSELALKVLLARWETQLSSKIFEFWLEPMESERWISDSLLLRYRELKHEEAVTETRVRISSMSHTNVTAMLVEEPIIREARIAKILRNPTESQTRDLKVFSEKTAPLDQCIRECLEEIRKQVPSFGRSSEFGVRDLERVRANLKSEECIVIPIYGFTNAHLIVVFPKRIRAFSMSDEDYKKLLACLVSYHGAVNFSPKFTQQVTISSDQEFDDVARVVGEIIEPIHDCFRDVLTEVAAYIGDMSRHVYIFHDANIACFPYHSVPIDEVQLFGDKFDVSYIPNLRMLESIKREAESSDGDVVVCGGRDRDLKFCSVEERLVWSSSSRTKCDNKHRSEVIESIENARIFHYCGHVDVNMETPLSSAIEIAGVHQLTVEDLLKNIRFHRCQVVILNGCGSAIYRRAMPPSWRQMDSPFYGVENEPISFSTAFLIAGARSTLTTLWPVWDLAACVFMWKFCSLAETGVEISIALRNTMKWMRSEICNGEYLAAKVVPELIRTVESKQDKKLLIRRLKDHASKHEDSPPFAHYSYWAGYVLSGVPW